MTIRNVLVSFADVAHYVSCFASFLWATCYVSALNFSGIISKVYTVASFVIFDLILLTWRIW